MHLRANSCASKEPVTLMESKTASGSIAQSEDNIDLIFYVTHTLPCVPLEDALMQLKSFMGQHKGEVVVIRICPDWSNREYLGPEQGEKVLEQARSVVSQGRI